MPAGGGRRDNVERYGTARLTTDDNTVQRMRVPRSITKATHTHTHSHTEHVILIAFPRQQWLRERASMLRYTYIASHVRVNV